MSSGGALVLLGVLFGMIVISGPLMLAAVNRRTPWGISQRLRAGTPSVVLRSSDTAGVWDPAKPLGRGNSTPNVPRWRATYSLTEDGMVALDLVRPDGRRERHIGPPVEAPEGYGRSARIGLLPSACYLIGAGAGMGVGLAAAGARGAVTGALVGFALAWFGLFIFAARRRARMTGLGDSSNAPQPSDEP